MVSVSGGLKVRLALAFLLTVLPNSSPSVNCAEAGGLAGEGKGVAVPKINKIQKAQAKKERGRNRPAPAAHEDCKAIPGKDAGGGVCDGARLPGCLARLMTAESFADGVAGESGLRENFKDYRQAAEQISALEVVDLEFLQKKATPAGRLYASVLLKESGRVGDDQAFGRLLGDVSKVTYLSGCKGCEVTLDEVARSFMKEGRFHNFRISIFCKLKAPVDN